MEKKLKQQDVATALKISRVSVTQWELGATKPTIENLNALASLLSVPLDYFFTKTRNEELATNAKIIGEVDFSGGKKLPVYGQAVAGVNGEFVMNDNILFEILCPPQLSSVADAYAIQVSGDSMSPRYEDGEIVYVDPTRRLKCGNYVVAQVMINETDILPQAFIKRFVKHNTEKLVLEQLNPGKNLTFPHEQVVSVHCVVLSGYGF